MRMFTVSIVLTGGSHSSPLFSLGWPNGNVESLAAPAHTAAQYQDDRQQNRHHSTGHDSHIDTDLALTASAVGVLVDGVA